MVFWTKLGHKLAHVIKTKPYHIPINLQQITQAIWQKLLNFPHEKIHLYLSSSFSFFFPFLEEVFFHLVLDSISFYLLRDAKSITNPLSSYRGFYYYLTFLPLRGEVLCTLPLDWDRFCDCYDQ